MAQSSARVTYGDVSSVPRTSSWMSLVTYGNAVISIVLSVVVALLIWQVQSLRQEIDNTHQQIDALMEQVQEEQQGQITQLTQAVEREHSLSVYQMAGTFTLLTSLITMFHISSHLRSFEQPVVQRKVIAILWMSPIYAATSFMSLLFPSANEYLAVIKDFYEAYVVYTFLSFLIAVLGRGDRQIAVEKLARHAQHLDKPFRCLNRFFHPAPHTSNQAMANAVLLECQMLCMQFVFLRPLTSILSFVASSLWPHDDGAKAYFQSVNFYLAMIMNLSVYLAFNGLLKFYHAVRDDLKHIQPFLKFLAIKGIVFLTFWQGLLISILVNLNNDNGNGHMTTAQAVSMGNGTVAGATNVTVVTTTTANLQEEDVSQHERAANIQNILICLEMLLFAIAHWCCFPADEWQDGYQRPTAHAGIGIKDFASDLRFVVSSSRGTSLRSDTVEMEDDTPRLGELSGYGSSGNDEESPDGLSRRHVSTDEDGDDNELL